MNAEFPYDAFLSHSAKDKAVVRPQTKAECRMQNAEFFHSPFFILHSLRAFGSDWAQLEAGTFRFRDPLNQERRFIPLRLDDACATRQEFLKSESPGPAGVGKEIFAALKTGND
jgi:hypothetical protein